MTFYSFELVFMNNRKPTNATNSLMDIEDLVEFKKLTASCMIVTLNTV